MSRKAGNLSSYEVFEDTMARLEQALSVGQIATFDITTCDAGADPQEVLEQYPNFDQIPVWKDGAVIGVLERGQGVGPTAAEAMRPLAVDMLAPISPTGWCRCCPRACRAISARCTRGWSGPASRCGKPR